MGLKIAAIKRKKIYSPNHTINDSLILSKTGNVLQKLGYDVVFYDESFLENNEINEKYLFSMARSTKVLKKLFEMEKSGACITNSPGSALNTQRIKMTKMLKEAKIPFPRSVIINQKDKTEDYFALLGAGKLWVKRGDVHAEHREDVTLVYSMDELNSILQEFHKRKIPDAVIQEHLPGDTIKFYGVRETDFFHWYYLNGNNNSPFNRDFLKDIAFKSADILGVDVFGGDVIISPEGNLSVIDINDWPSFAPVRDKAAEYIGNFIHEKVQKLCPSV